MILRWMYKRYRKQAWASGQAAMDFTQWDGRRRFRLYSRLNAYLMRACGIKYVERAEFRSKPIVLQTGSHDAITVPIRDT